VGKTRLALQVAAALRERYPQGVWLVELAALADPVRVPDAVITTLEVQEQPGRLALETLCDALRTRQLLLLLDNCEHLLEACAGLGEALLRACPRVVILATSREPLGLAGETRWRVPSLSVAAPDQGASPAAVARSEAGQLFLERARAVQPAFALSPANAAAVAEVCARLDGIPLAIELAAARLSALGVAELAARLDQRFRLLTGGSRTALPRQQTLQATMGWSYDLLTPQEQLLFARLSVFAGGWSLDGAEATCAGEAIVAEEVLDLLVRLVDRSLVMAEEVAGEGTTWYRLLETLRHFGGERLAPGEAARCRRRHAAYYLALAERADRELIGPDALRWFDLLEREHDNLRAALAWCMTERDHGQEEEDAEAVEMGLRLAGSLFWFWLFHDHHAEGLAWLDQALARGAAAPAAVRAYALFGAGVLASFVNDLTRSHLLLSQSVALRREAGDRRQLSRALSTLGWALWRSGQVGEAATALAEGLAVARALDEAWPIAYALMHGVFRVAHTVAIDRAEERAHAWAAGTEALYLFQAADDSLNSAIMQLHLGRIALYEGDYERARAMFVASLPLMRALGWRTAVAHRLVNLAYVAREQGDDREATACYAEALTLYRHLGDHQSLAVAWLLSHLAAIALEQGEWTAAQTHVAESLALLQDARHDAVPELAGPVEVRAALAAADPAGLITATATVLPGTLETQAALAAVQGTPDRALRLAGAAAALRARLNRPLAPAEQDALERRLAPARQALSAEQQATAWAAGQAMTREQAIADALAGLPSAPGTPPHVE
jgi:non-specific serine/threonine protein kinase